jgi:hypothetical protein
MAGTMTWRRRAGGTPLSDQFRDVWRKRHAGYEHEVTARDVEYLRGVLDCADLIADGFASGRYGTELARAIHAGAQEVLKLIEVHGTIILEEDAGS